MTKIIGIAGKKQSGKNTVANIIHGLVLKEKGLVIDYNIGSKGQLMVLTTDAGGTEGWGEFDVNRMDPDFVNYSENNISTSTYASLKDINKKISLKDF